MIHSAVCSQYKVMKDLPLSQVKKYLKDKDAVVWIDLEKPVESEYVFLEETFKFHKLVMEDCRKFIELPKVDFFEDYIFVVLHSISHDLKAKHPEKREIYFFLGKNFLVTVHRHSSSSVSHLFDKLEKNPEGINKKADFFMYEIVDYFVDSYFPLLNFWDEKIEELEDNIIAHKNLDSSLKEIMRIKRELLYLKKSIMPQRDVIGHLSRRDFPFIHPRTSVYFRDVSDHIMQVYSELEMQHQILGGDFEAYNSVLSNRLAIISNRMNEVMKRLTVIATIFMPITFIASIYGTNFKFMPELNWPYAYFAFWILILVVGVSMYWFFRKKHWM